MKVVIRAGGVGSRLWPMSRKRYPKQFQKIVGDKSMLLNTYERVRPMFEDGGSIFVSINHEFQDRLRQELPEVPPSNTIIETDTRNTGPAMCLEVCFLEDLVSRDDIIATLPSDDYISDSQAFRDLLFLAEKFLKNNSDVILTPAVRAEFPDVGYTYFKTGKNLATAGEEAIFEVDTVVEKPNKEYCQELLDSGVYFCHTGMYVWRLGTIIDLFRQFEPTLYAICRAVVNATRAGDLMKARELYSGLEKNSIESLITKKADKLAMSVSNKIGWSDLGKWHIIKRMTEKSEYDNIIQGEVYANKSTNNLIYSNNRKKIVVANNVHNLVVVDTDDALFISSLEDSADIKEIMEKLKDMGRDHYL